MLRRFLLIALLVSFAASAQASSRYVTDRQGAPVQWREWGSAALAEAKKQNRPIFLSIGYAASYEAYKMHREAFINGEIAEALNAYFIPVLLDRIEHPEIAAAYETIARSMNGSTGWPINLILTPALEPFDGGGVLSPSELSRMLVINANRWADARDAAIADARATVEKARALGERHAPAPVDATTIEAVVDEVAASYDADHGGFAGVPRRPHPMTVSFLLRYAARAKHEPIRGTAIATLRKLAATPLRDQLGGGFHRAARDREWQQPYFEKMLPDQALLAIAYLEAWQITRDPELEHVARTTLEYVLRDLRPSAGAFDAAQDAHNLVPDQGPEFKNGAFYRWTKDEIVHLVGRENGGKIAALYGIEDGSVALPVPQASDVVTLARGELAAPLAKLLEVRQRRPAPFRERMGVAGWNGLMISALARAGAAFDERAYLDAANAAAVVVTSKLWSGPKKTLYRVDASTRPRGEAVSEDYALLVQGLIDLFEAGHDVKWLALAMTLQKRQDELFWDERTGRYATGTSVPKNLSGLLAEIDGEVPAVNSVAALNLLRLAALTGNETWRTRPAMIFESFGGRLRTRGSELVQLAAAYEDSLLTPRIVVVTGEPWKEETRAAVGAARAGFAPMRFVILVPPKGAARERVTNVLPFIRALAPDPERPVTYDCANGECVRR